jgi:hypothetical protein
VLRQPPSLGASTATVAAPVHSVPVDVQLVVPSDGSRHRDFTLSASSKVHVNVDGEVDTAKGFDVYVLSADEYLRYLTGDYSTAEISETQTQGFNHTQSLEAGVWYVVVENKYNTFNSMTVHVRVDVN